MATRSIADRVRALIEARDIHLAACRAKRQHLACGTCSDLTERAISYARLLAAEAPSDQLVVADGVVTWSWIAA